MLQRTSNRLIGRWCAVVQKAKSESKSPGCSQAHIVSKLRYYTSYGETKDRTADHRKLFDSIGTKLRITSPEGWYNVKKDDIHREGGGSILYSFYNNSVHKAITTIYPSHKWHEWEFERLNAKFWKDLANRRRFLDHVAHSQSITNWDGWYEVTASAIKSLGGSVLLAQYDNSLAKLLNSTYTQHEWYEWNFHRVPRSFWSDQTNVNNYLVWLGKRLGFQTMDDWYSVSPADFAEKSGSGLLASQSSSDSILSIMSLGFPDHQWKAWLFRNSPPSTEFWSVESNRRDFLEFIQTNRSITSVDNWYQLSTSDIEKLGGASIIKMYGGSVYRMLAAIYPSHRWVEFKFQDRISWSSVDTHRAFLDWVGSELKLQSMEDWYHVTVPMVHAKGGSGLLSHYYNDSLALALRTVYEDHHWDDWRFNAAGSLAEKP